MLLLEACPSEVAAKVVERATIPVIGCGAGPACHGQVLVLHDLPNGAMRHLDRFLGEVQDQGWQFRPGPPPGCVPLRRGVPGPDFARYISDT